MAGNNFSYGKWLVHDCQPKLGMTTKLNNLEVNCDLLKLITPIRNRLMQYNGLMPRRAITDNVIAMHSIIMTYVT